jgi:hypothetical protein
VFIASAFAIAMVYDGFISFSLVSLLFIAATAVSTIAGIPCRCSLFASIIVNVFSSSRRSGSGFADIVCFCRVGKTEFCSTFSSSEEKLAGLHPIEYDLPVLLFL